MRRHVPKKVLVEIEGDKKILTVTEAVEEFVKRSRIDPFTPYLPRLEDALLFIQKH